MWHRISLSTDLDCSKWRSYTPVSDNEDDDVVVPERATHRLEGFCESHQLPVLDRGTLSYSHVVYAYVRKPDARHSRANTDSVAGIDPLERSIRSRVGRSRVK
ncbi:hypothetical protein KM043_010334 [Ampulex compressa]|nr:hypothetical protein KM043_010334 [Ampulex compressa]